MAFRFTLAALLKVRAAAEERERGMLRSLLLRRAELLQGMRCAGEHRQQARERLSRAMLQPGLQVADVQLEVNWSDALRRRQHLLRSQFVELHGKIEQQTSRYLAARRGREVLETLRDRQLRSYQAVAQRREQAQLDESHLLRRKRP